MGTCWYCRLLGKSECVYKRQGMNKVEETPEGYKELGDYTNHHCQNFKEYTYSSNQIIPEIKTIRL